MFKTCSDTSVFYIIKSKELTNIQVWKGNRFIDLKHAESIKTAIDNKIENLDSTVFRVVKYKDGITEQRYIVDGQHRQYVIKKYYEEQNILDAFNINFDVLVHEKTVDSEAEAIKYFNAINNVKPQQDNEPNILANKYLQINESL